jgi:hypothetical protein
MAAPTSSRPAPEAVSRRALFAIAAALAATVLTGAVAIAGLTRNVSPAPSVPAVGQTLTPAAPVIPTRVEPGG